MTHSPAVRQGRHAYQLPLSCFRKPLFSAALLFVLSKKVRNGIFDDCCNLVNLYPEYGKK